MINAAISDIPADMTITMHLCRGNFRSTFVASGGYEPVAEILFNSINVHGYFMEYDIDARRRLRAAALRAEGQDRGARPRHHQIGRAGKPRTSSSAASTRQRNTSPLDQLCLSPQCGFASTEEGNVLAEDEQWAKLRMIVELADEVWGSYDSKRDQMAEEGNMERRRQNDERDINAPSRPFAPTTSAACCAPRR